MKCALEVGKQCADMSSVSTSEMSEISVLVNLVENSRIPSLQNNFNEMWHIA